MDASLCVHCFSGVVVHVLTEESTVSHVRVGIYSLVESIISLR